MSEAITKKRIADALQSLSIAHSPHEVFFDFVASAAYAFVNLLEPDSKKKAAREESYLSLQKKYSPEEVKKFGDILGMTLLYADQEDGIYDVLGPIYESMGISNKKTGQFFTPQNVAELVANLAIDPTVEEKIKEHGYITIYEPASGAGVNVLMAAQSLKNRGYNPQQVMLVYAADIDKNCMYMTYFHLSIYGIPAVVQHCDTLSMAEWDRWETPAYWLGLWNWRERYERQYKKPDYR